MRAAALALALAALAFALHALAGLHVCPDGSVVPDTWICNGAP